MPRPRKTISRKRSVEKKTTARNVPWYHSPWLWHAGKAALGAAATYYGGRAVGAATGYALSQVHPNWDYFEKGWYPYEEVQNGLEDHWQVVDDGWGSFDDFRGESESHIYDVDDFGRR